MEPRHLICRSSTPPLQLPVPDLACALLACAHVTQSRFVRSLGRDVGYDAKTANSPYASLHRCTEGVPKARENGQAKGGRHRRTHNSRIRTQLHLPQKKQEGNGTGTGFRLAADAGPDRFPRGVGRRQPGAQPEDGWEERCSCGPIDQRGAPTLRGQAVDGSVAECRTGSARMWTQESSVAGAWDPARLGARHAGHWACWALGGVERSRDETSDALVVRPMHLRTRRQTRLGCAGALGPEGQQA